MLTTSTSFTPVNPIAPALCYLIYDDTCGFCIRSAKRILSFYGTSSLVLLKGSMPETWPALVSEALPNVVAGQERSDSARIRLVVAPTPSQPAQYLTGADALVALTALKSGLLVVRLAARLPGVMPILRWFYDQVAQRRHRISQWMSWPVACDPQHPEACEPVS